MIWREPGGQAAGFFASLESDEILTLNVSSILQSHLKLLVGVSRGNQTSETLSWFLWTRSKLQMASFQRPPLIIGRARMVQNCVLGVFILVALIATQPASAGRSLLESEDSAKTHHLYWTVIDDIELIISRGPNWLQFPSTDPFSFLFFLLFWVQIESGKRRISSSVIEQLSDGRSFTLRVDLVNNVLSFLNYRCNSQQQS